MSRENIPERTRIFVGCEGGSEHGYSTFLAKLTQDLGLRVFVDPHILKEGDPLSRIEKAQKIIEQQEGKRGSYQRKFAFLDTDQRERDPDRARQAVVLAGQLDITIIWQEPDHEGLVLQHFPAAPRRAPRTKADSMRGLHRFWAHYEKNSTALQYRGHLDEAAVLVAAGRVASLRTLCVAAQLIIEPVEEAQAVVEPAAKMPPLEI